MTATAREKRHAIAAGLRLALGPAWTVYAGPVSVPVAPSAMVTPRSPYRTQLTMADEEISLRILLLVGVGDADALDTLDDALDALGIGLSYVEVGSIQWISSDTPGPQVIGGAEYLAASADITI